MTERRLPSQELIELGARWFAAGLTERQVRFALAEAAGTDLSDVTALACAAGSVYEDRKRRAA